MRMVAQHGGDVGITRDHRDGPEQIENPWRACEQRLVVRIRIGAKSGIPRVEINVLCGLIHCEISSFALSLISYQSDRIARAARYAAIGVPPHGSRQALAFSSAGVHESDCAQSRDVT